MKMLKAKGNVQVCVEIHEDIKEPELYVVIDGKKVKVNYSSGEMENELNEFMIDEELVANLSEANELLDEMTDKKESIGPHMKYTFKEEFSEDIKELYKKCKLG